MSRLFQRVVNLCQGMVSRNTTQTHTVQMLSCSGVFHKTWWTCSTYMRKSALSYSEHTSRFKCRACCEEHSSQTPMPVLYMPTCVYVHIRGGADKSFARPTSRCHRTESIVSLERGVCSCGELQVFSCYRG